MPDLSQWHIKEGEDGGGEEKGNESSERHREKAGEKENIDKDVGQKIIRTADISHGWFEAALEKQAGSSQETASHRDHKKCWEWFGNINLNGQAEGKQDSSEDTGMVEHTSQIGWQVFGSTLLFPRQHTRAEGIKDSSVRFSPGPREGALLAKGACVKNLPGKEGKATNKGKQHAKSQSGHQNSHSVISQKDLLL